MDPDQTAIGAVCSGSTLFASMLNSSVMLGNYLQQTTSADEIFICIFFSWRLIRVRQMILLDMLPEGEAYSCQFFLLSICMYKPTLQYGVLKSVQLCLWRLGTGSMFRVRAQGDCGVNQKFVMATDDQNSKMYEGRFLCS